MIAEIGQGGLTIRHLLWRIRHLYPHKPFWTPDARGEPTRRTYRDLLATTSRYASVLTETAPAQGDCIATLAWNDESHLATILAVNASGRVVLPLNPRSSLDHLRHVLARVPVRAIVADGELVELAETLAGAPGYEVTVLRVGTQESAAEGTPHLDEVARDRPATFDWPEVDENSPALVSYTSGTTGPPKGVVFSHRSQMQHALMSLAVDTLGVCERDVILPTAPFFHANSQGLPYSALLAGASLVLPGRRAGAGEHLASLVRSLGVTCFGGIPTVVHRLVTNLRSAAAEPLAGTRILCGGFGVDRALADSVSRLGGQMIQVWGMTETSPIATVSRPRSWLDEEAGRRSVTAQGTPVAGVEVDLRDLDTGEPIAWDGRSSGELRCRGPWIVNDYLWGQWPDGAHEWLRTGDVASIDENGYVRVRDRLKDLIKSGGEWVPAQELERLILAVDGVAECAVIGVPDAEWGERPAAYVVPTRPAEAGALGEAIRVAVKESAPAFWAPDEVRVVPELPRTPTEKIDKVSLRQRWSG
jgi:fatty-acyl-CoA synthase